MSTADLYEQLAHAAEDGRSTTDPLAEVSEVALYGASGVGREVARLLTTKGWLVRCFLDQNARPGDQIAGIPVLQADDPALAAEVREKTPVILTVFNPDVDVAALRVHLRGLGWRNPVPFVRFHRRFARELGDRYWLTDLEFYRDKAAALRAGAALWADECSREIYDAILRFRLEADPALLPAPDLEHHYFAGDVPTWRTPCRFVDGGAYDGDTLEALRCTGLALEAVAAFEPDPTNIRRLAAPLAALAEAGVETLLWPCAVADRTTTLRFSSGQGAASGLSDAGAETVQAVSLDEALADFRPTLIKLDIEGAEPDARHGARHLIERHRPGMAVCVYHQPAHLWKSRGCCKAGGSPTAFTSGPTATTGLISCSTPCRMPGTLEADPKVFMIRVVDYLFQTLADHGVRHVFLVTGGGGDAPQRRARARRTPPVSVLPPRASRRLCRRGLGANHRADRGGQHDHGAGRDQRPQQRVRRLDGFYPMLIVSGRSSARRCWRRTA